jgi:hypothetical protein
MAGAVEISYIIRSRTQSREEGTNDAAYRDTSSDRDFGEAA